jgi:hypothetical protein
MNLCVCVCFFLGGGGRGEYFYNTVSILGYIASVGTRTVK